MTDPIRPFINLIESIAATSGAQQSREASSQKTITKHNDPNSSRDAVTLSFSERLAARLSVIDRDDHKRRRRVFIELALLTELGEQLAVDNAMGELVERVSSIIATNQQMATDLDIALDSIAS